MPVLGSGVEICTSTTRPSNPVVGTMIYETDTASYRWCSATSPITWIGMIPVGTVQSFAGSTAPPGWLFCFGQSLNASTSPQYADLWALLGTTYGGSGITAFNLPDLRGRAPFGKDNMGGSTAGRVTATSGITGTTLGASGGDERMQSHSHNTTFKTAVQASYPVNQDHLTRSQPSSWSTVGIQSDGAGSGGSQNMPPAIILNYIIKY